MYADAEPVPVLIIGGSLVGLSAAVFLASRGVPCVVVERHGGTSPHPRAIGYTARTLELFRAVDLDLPVHVGGGPPRRARVESLAGTWHEESHWTPGEGRPVGEFSPVGGTAIAQDLLEPILRDRAVELGTDLRASTELTGFTEVDDGVTATLRERGGGREYQLRARYLVAADGAKSAVREALGIGRTGWGQLSVQRSILFRAPLEKFLEHGVAQFEVEQPDLKAFLTTYADGRWVLMLSEDMDRGEDEQRQIIRQATGLPDLPVELLTSGRWELAALIADRYRDGRVFLAGDAAHQLPPNRGGFGVNTGIDDVHNLAWKLAAVLAGESTPALLDTYEAERRPIALLRNEQIFARGDVKVHLDEDAPGAPIIEEAALELGQLYRSPAVLGAGDDLPPAQRPDLWAGQSGTRAPHVQILIGDQECSTLDLFQRSWVVLSEDARWAPAVEQVAATLGIAVAFVHCGVAAKPVQPGEIRIAYGIDADGATLVRPDGYIAWRSITAPADRRRALIAALGQVASPSTTTEIR